MPLFDFQADPSTVNPLVESIFKSQTLPPASLTPLTSIFQSKSGQKVEAEEEEVRVSSPKVSFSPEALIEKPTTDSPRTKERDPRKKRHKTKSRDPQEKQDRTIFVGNVPTACIDDQLSDFKSLFQTTGSVESIRFRSLALSKPGLGFMKKVGFIQKDLHEERDSCNAYVVYKTKESAQSALALNGTCLAGKHLRVDSSTNDQKYDTKRSVFVGNLSFQAEEEVLWEHFKECGEIANVRIIRDPATSFGKGFAYVEFKERAAVSLALKLNGTPCGERKLRISRCMSKKSDGENDSTKEKTPNASGEKRKALIKKKSRQDIKPSFEGERGGRVPLEKQKKMKKAKSPVAVMPKKRKVGEKKLGMKKRKKDS